MQDNLTLPFDAASPPERWLPVVGYEGLYIVSDHGRVMSLHRDGLYRQPMKAHLLGKPPKNLYLAVRLSRHGHRRRILVHALVTAAFIGPRPPGLIVRHGPAGQFANSLPNLCYGTYSQNNGEDKHRDGTAMLGEANFRAILTEEMVREARTRHAQRQGTYESLAAEYGVCFNTIRLAITRKTWKHVA